MNNYEEKLQALGGHPLRDNIFLPLTESDVQDIEDAIGRRLPSDFRAFFAACGGYRFADDVYAPILDDCASGQEVNISVFLGKVGINHYALPDIFGIVLKRLPPNLLPIAVDPGANLVCIATSGTMEGAVFFWEREDEVDHPHPVEVDVDNDVNVYLMARTFSAFIDSLTNVEP